MYIHVRLRLKATWYIEDIGKICKIVGRGENEKHFLILSMFKLFSGLIELIVCITEENTVYRTKYLII